ncbi:disheveled-associated activator of morphogenesis 2-like isoform X3 [Sparus aurata]|uniref:disheveled-associated activator of morphogenesis 2-like isoform X3 n=1 Tax=Sparus aurata TaxID=8175 RepID=UPI0011C0E1BE|nr:disheveled-associated activator of morphogenesis 2-like isoform X3 [Sparus aurata]
MTESTNEVEEKLKQATYEIARTKLVEYEQNTDVPTVDESDCAENMGRGKRKKRRVILSSEDEDDDDWSSSPIRPTPPPSPSTLRSSSPPPPSTFMSVLTPPSTLRSVLTPPLPPPTLKSSPPPPPCTRHTPPPPLGNLRWPNGSTHHQLTTSPPETPRTQIRDSMFVRISTLLEEMKETQRIQGRMLQTLLQQRGNIGTTASSTPEGFPLTDSCSGGGHRREYCGRGHKKDDDLPPRPWLIQAVQLCGPKWEERVQGLKTVRSNIWRLEEKPNDKPDHAQRWREGDVEVAHWCEGPGGKRPDRQITPE